MMQPINLVCTVIYFLVKPLIKSSRNTGAGPAPGGVTRQNRPGGSAPCDTHVLPFAGVKLKTQFSLF